MLAYGPQNKMNTNTQNVGRLSVSETHLGYPVGSSGRAEITQPKQIYFDLKTATFDIVNKGLSKNSTMQVR